MQLKHTDLCSVVEGAVTDATRHSGWQRALQWGAPSHSRNLSGPGTESMSPALAGGFFTTRNEGDVSYMVGVEGSGRESSLMSSFWKTKWLIPTSTAPGQTTERWTKVSGISQQKTRNFPSGKHRTTCFSDDQAKTVTAGLGSSDSSAMVTRHSTFGIPLILVFTKFSLKKNFKNLSFFLYLTVPHLRYSTWDL